MTVVATRKCAIDAASNLEESTRVIATSFDRGARRADDRAAAIHSLARCPNRNAVARIPRAVVAKESLQTLTTSGSQDSRSNVISEPPSLAPRSTFEIVDDALQLLRARFLFCICATTPLQLLAILAAAQFQKPEPGNLSAAMLTFLVTIGLVVAVQCFATGMVTVEIYSRLTGTTISVGRALLGVSRRAAPLVIASGIVAGLTVCATMLFVIPGLLFAAMFSAAVPALMIEGVGVFAAFGRSRALNRGSFGRWFALAVMSQAITVVPLASISLLDHPSVPPWIAAHAGVSPMFARSFVVLAAATVQGVATAVHATIWVRWYLDLRARKEAFDLRGRFARLAGLAAGAVA